MEATVSICDRNRIAGKRFGRLTVIEQTSKYKTYPNGRSSFLWECRCDCGGVAYAERDKLLKGKTVSCGCWKDIKDTQHISAGQRFGRLVAVRRTQQRDAKRFRLWEFKCDCGKTCLRPSSLVISGNTSSCGCLRREIEAANLRASVEEIKRKTDLTGYRIGLLTVEGVDHVHELGHQLYRCVCVCGNIRLSKRSDLLRRRASNSKTNYPKSCGCKGRGLIERCGSQWKMIGKDQIVPLDLHDEART